MDSTSKDEIGKALGRVASGLYIVTARHEGKAEGMLGSWVMQAAFEPPMITLALGVDRGIRALVEGSGFFAVNVLGKDDGGLMSPFFKPPPEGECVFAPLNTADCEAAGGAPLLLDGHAWLGCEVAGTMEAGDNVIVLGKVVAGRLLKDAEPKIHVRKDGFKY